MITHSWSKILQQRRPPCKWEWGWGGWVGGWWPISCSMLFLWQLSSRAHDFKMLHGGHSRPSYVFRYISTSRTIDHYWWNFSASDSVCVLDHPRIVKIFDKVHILLQNNIAHQINNDKDVLELMLFSMYDNGLITFWDMIKNRWKKVIWARSIHNFSWYPKFWASYQMNELINIHMLQFTLFASPCGDSYGSFDWKQTIKW